MSGTPKAVKPKDLSVAFTKLLLSHIKYKQLAH